MLPDWNSVESTARWSDLLFWTGIIALCLLAASIMASRILANRSNFLTHEVGTAATTSAVSASSAGRHLTDAQETALEAALAPYAGQKISFACNSGDLEGEAYAREFRAVFAKAGWSIVGGDNVQAVVLPQPIGINLYINRAEFDARRAPKSAVVLAQTLLQLGLVRGGVIGAMNQPDIPPEMIGFFAGKAH